MLVATCELSPSLANILTKPEGWMDQDSKLTRLFRYFTKALDFWESQGPPPKFVSLTFVIRFSHFC
jgi:hypothetical protein